MTLNALCWWRRPTSPYTAGGSVSDLYTGNKSLVFTTTADTEVFRCSCGGPPTPSRGEGGHRQVVRLSEAQSWHAGGSPTLPRTGVSGGALWPQTAVQDRCQSLLAIGLPLRRGPVRAATVRRDRSHRGASRTRIRYLRMCALWPGGPVRRVCQLALLKAHGSGAPWLVHGTRRPDIDRRSPLMNPDRRRMRPSRACVGRPTAHVRAGVAVWRRCLLLEPIVPIP